MRYPISIIIAALILGSFYSYSQHEKQISIERQVQMQIEQENHVKALEEEQEIKKEETQQAEQAMQAKIKTQCSHYLERNGNYLVTNETLTTNYDACLHANGL